MLLYVHQLCFVPVVQHLKSCPPPPFSKYLSLDGFGYFLQNMFRDFILCAHLSWIPNSPILSPGNVTYTHTFSVLYFVLVFFLFAVVCIQLFIIFVVMKITNAITSFRCSLCSSDDILIGGSRFRKAIFAYIVHFTCVT